MPPLVSVIIPCYNGEAYIKNAIKSVDSQTYKNIEIIVVDDGSEDDSISIVENTQTEYDLTLVERDINGGISAARNTGLHQAGGKYIGFLDQDDVWYAEKVERQVQHMNSNPDIGITYTDMHHINTEGDVFSTRHIQTDFKKMSTEETATYLFRYWEHTPLPLTSELIKKEVFDCVGDYNETLFGLNDRELAFRALKKFKISHINGVLMGKRYHSENASKQSRRLLEDRQDLTENLVSKYPQLQQYQDDRKSHIQLSLAWCELSDGDFLKAINHLKQGVERSPSFVAKMILHQGLRSL